MGQPRFEFHFRDATVAQKGTLANLTIELWVDTLCVIRTKGWSIRDGRNGVYPQGPQYDSKRPRKDDPSKTQWVNYIQFFPSTNESGFTPQFKAFQEQCVQEYQAWVANGKPQDRGNQYNQNQNQGGASLTPRIPAAQVPPVGPTLPQGWTSNLDRQTGRRYFTDPQGNVYLEGDPRLTAALSGTPKPAAVPANDPFASFGSVPGR